MKTKGWIVLWAMIAYGLSFALMVLIVYVGVKLVGA